jgi:hypothetical protein
MSIFFKNFNKTKKGFKVYGEIRFPFSRTLWTILWLFLNFQNYNIATIKCWILLKPVIEGVDGNLHLLLPSTNRPNQTKPATFSVMSFVRSLGILCFFPFYTIHKLTWQSSRLWTCLIILNFEYILKYAQCYTYWYGCNMFNFRYSVFLYFTQALLFFFLEKIKIPKESPKRQNWNCWRLIYLIEPVQIKIWLFKSKWDAYVFRN